MSEPMIVGWREWVALPDLGLPAIRCKIDTGAATSAIHAREIAEFERGGEPWVRFVAQPFHRRNRKLTVVSEAPIVDRREITSSSGHAEERLVVRTRFRLGIDVEADAWPIELTLANRKQLRFPMLLGREAMEGRILINPGASDTLRQPHRPMDLYPSRR